MYVGLLIRFFVKNLLIHFESLPHLLGKVCLYLVHHFRLSLDYQEQVMVKVLSLACKANIRLRVPLGLLNDKEGRYKEFRAGKNLPLSKLF